MRVARVKVSAGKAAEFNADGNGYAPSGESQYSRASAHGDQRMTRLPSSKIARRISKGNKLPPQTLAEEYAGRVRWLEAELRGETDSTRRVKLTKNLEIKRRRLDELRRELFLEQRP
jgi:hypothetical protein